MLRHASRIGVCDVISADGSVGKVHGILFDEARWRFRSVTADIGSWLAGERVRLPLAAVREIDESQRLLHVHLTKVEIEPSPEYDPKRTSERGYEQSLHDHYRHRPYWREPKP